jgi:membrane-associated protease RseP (regulator of RpoE activity)
VAPAAGRRWLPILLLATTVLTTLWAGAWRELPASGEQFADLIDAIEQSYFPVAVLLWPRALLLGLPYCLTVLGILGAHELGHYLACRHYGVRATWPHFIPMPMPQSYGTMGAFIRIRSPIPSRRALFDIAVAGPLAGFALCVPALAYGIWSAKVSVPPPEAGGIYYSDSLLVGALAKLRWGALSPGEEIIVGSVFVAGWLGQLATCLNLFPVGQLDGGHLLYAVTARWHRILSYAARWSFAAFLVFLIFLPGAGIMGAAPWLLWLVLLFAVGDRHPPVVAWQPLGRARVGLLVVSLVIFVITFMPVPVRLG